MASSLTLLSENGGGVAIAFTVFAFLGSIAAIIWCLCTSLGKGPGILQNNVVAAIICAICAVLSLIAWATFVGCIKSNDSFDNYDPHYSWVLNLIGCFLCIGAAVLMFVGGGGGATAK